MKQQILFSPDASDSTGSSEPVKRLAARYNIPEKDVEALLYGTRAPKSDTAGFDTKEKSMADEFRSNYGAPQRQSGWSPVNVLSLVVGILGVMALTIILIAVLRRPIFHHMSEGMPHPPPPMMMSPNQPAQTGGVDSSRKQIPSMNDNQGAIPPPATMNEMDRPMPKPRRHSSSRSSAFTTSNSVEAQEHLAEMRADGNTKARIRMKTKNGVTIYSVQ